MGSDTKSRETASELNPNARPQPLLGNRWSVENQIESKELWWERKETTDGASPVVQGLRICLPIQGTRVLIPDRQAKIPPAKPVLSPCVQSACSAAQKTLPWATTGEQPSLHATRRARSNKDPAQPKIDKCITIIFKKKTITLSTANQARVLDVKDEIQSL